MAKRMCAESTKKEAIPDQCSQNTHANTLKLEPSVLDRITELDCRLSAAISVGARPKTNGVVLTISALKFLEVTGHGVPWLIFTALYAFNSGGYTQIFSINVFMALILDLLIVVSVKVAAKRQRPVYNKDDMFATVSVDKYSFPSGHTTRVIMLAFLFMYFDLPLNHVLLIMIWALTVAVSRIVLGRHHILDVTAGVIIGAFEAWLMLRHLWMDEDSIRTIVSELNDWLLKNNFSSLFV